jgi:hypothetical protein
MPNAPPVLPLVILYRTGDAEMAKERKMSRLLFGNEIDGKCMGRRTKLQMEFLNFSSDTANIT